MNEMEYVYEVYKERSFSAAAKNLYVSQPALSTAIKKVEEALGITIFDRTISPIAVTEEGRVYIEAVEKILMIEKEMKERLADMSELRSGHLVVSGENFVSSFVLPPVMKRFFAKYEGIVVEVVESNMPDLRKQLLTESIDLLIAHDFDPNLYTSLPIFEETILLAVPKGFAVNASLERAAMTRDDVLSGRHLSADAPEAVDLSAFSDMEFLLMKQGNDMYRRANRLFELSGMTPGKTLYLDQLITAYNLALGGMGIAFVTDTLISAAPGEGCVYYRISAPQTTRTMSIGYKKGRYMSHACQAFMDTAIEVFEGDPRSALRR